MSGLLSKIKEFLGKWDRPDADVAISVEQNKGPIGEEKIAKYCPYCNSKSFVKRGIGRRFLKNRSKKFLSQKPLTG